MAKLTIENTATMFKIETEGYLHELFGLLRMAELKLLQYYHAEPPNQALAGDAAQPSQNLEQQ